MILVATTDNSFNEQSIALSTYGEIIVTRDITQYTGKIINACIDFTFDNSTERIAQLSSFNAEVIIVNHVCGTTKELPDNFVRLNAWPGFFDREIAECATKNDNVKNATEKTFAVFGKKVEWVTDTPGFVSARIVAMIVNEAYHALGEGVSTKAEIDIAMKTGTNYPMGPFEWGELIGIKKIFELLEMLAATHSKYTPCEQLKKEALQ